MEAAAAQRWGTGLEGKTVLVLGAGKVGGEVIRLLVQRHAEVIASDVADDRLLDASRSGAALLVDPSDALSMPADILCPCALGGLLTEHVAHDLHVEIIVGAANNQLATDEVADALAQAGILYVPDFLANAGGIINIAEEADGYETEQALKAVLRIGETTTEVLERAATRGITPVAAAAELVTDRLDRARNHPGHSIGRTRVSRV
jgi:leucine dehydrogenase